MVEFSAGYKAKAAARLKVLEKSMTPKANAVARSLSGNFEKSSTKQVSSKPNRAA